jgi:hypothetical protein
MSNPDSCSSCGTKMEHDDVFCGECGTPARQRPSSDQAAGNEGEIASASHTGDFPKGTQAPSTASRSWWRRTTPLVVIGAGVLAAAVAVVVVVVFRSAASPAVYILARSNGTELSELRLGASVDKAASAGQRFFVEDTSTIAVVGAETVLQNYVSVNDEQVAIAALTRDGYGLFLVSADVRRRIELIRPTADRLQATYVPDAETFIVTVERSGSSECRQVGLQGRDRRIGTGRCLVVDSATTLVLEEVNSTTKVLVAGMDGAVRDRFQISARDLRLDGGRSWLVGTSEGAPVIFTVGGSSVWRPDARTLNAQIVDIADDAPVAVIALDRGDESLEMVRVSSIDSPVTAAVDQIALAPTVGAFLSPDGRVTYVSAAAEDQQLVEWDVYDENLNASKIQLRMDSVFFEPSGERLFAWNSDRSLLYAGPLTGPLVDIADVYGDPTFLSMSSGTYVVDTDRQELWFAPKGSTQLEFAAGSVASFDWWAPVDDTRSVIAYRTDADQTGMAWLTGNRVREFDAGPNVIWPSVAPDGRVYYSLADSDFRSIELYRVAPDDKATPERVAREVVLVAERDRWSRSGGVSFDPQPLRAIIDEDRRRCIREGLPVVEIGGRRELEIPAAGAELCVSVRTSSAVETDLTVESTSDLVMLLEGRSGSRQTFDDVVDQRGATLSVAPSAFGVELDPGTYRVQLVPFDGVSLSRATFEISPSTTSTEARSTRAPRTYGEALARQRSACGTTVQIGSDVVLQVSRQRQEFCIETPRPARISARVTNNGATDGPYLDIEMTCRQIGSVNFYGTGESRTTAGNVDKGIEVCGIVEDFASDGSVGTATVTISEIG